MQALNFLNGLCMKKNWSRIYRQNWIHLFKTEKRYSADTISWYAYHSFKHPLGIVIISEWYYTNNKGVKASTDFETVINTFAHKMSVDKVDLSDHSLKILAGKFLRQAITKSKGL